MIYLRVCHQNLQDCEVNWIEKARRNFIFHLYQANRKSKSARVVAYNVREVSCLVSLSLFAASRGMILDKTSQRSIGSRINFRWQEPFLQENYWSDQLSCSQSVQWNEVYPSQQSKEMSSIVAIKISLTYYSC